MSQERTSKTRWRTQLSFEGVCSPSATVGPQLQSVHGQHVQHVAHLKWALARIGLVIEVMRYVSTFRMLANSISCGLEGLSKAWQHCSMRNWVQLLVPHPG